MPPLVNIPMLRAIDLKVINLLVMYQALTRVLLAMVLLKFCQRYNFKGETNNEPAGRSGGDKSGIISSPAKSIATVPS